MTRPVTQDPGLPEVAPDELPAPATTPYTKRGVGVPGHERLLPKHASWRGDYAWRKEFPQGVWLDDDLPDMIAQLSPRQKTYVAMRVRGESQHKAAERLLASAQTVKEWEDAPWFDLAVQMEQERFFGNVNGQLLPLIPQAVSRLAAEISGAHGDINAHESAIWVLEKIGGKPTQKVESKQDPAANTQANDIVAILRETANIVAQMNSGTPASPPTALPGPTVQDVHQAQVREVAGDA